MEIGIKGSLKSLIKKLDKVDKGFDSGEFLEDTAKLVNSSIQRRVQKDGKGIKGFKMKPYSGKYGEYKQSTGRQVSFRDLTFSGNMWQSLTTSKGRNTAKMFFNSKEEAVKAAGNNKRTPFFGISPKERAILKRELKNLLNGNQS